MPLDKMHFGQSQWAPLSALIKAKVWIRRMLNGEALIINDERYQKCWIICLEPRQVACGSEKVSNRGIHFYIYSFW